MAVADGEEIAQGEGWADLLPEGVVLADAGGDVGEVLFHFADVGRFAEPGRAGFLVERLEIAAQVGEGGAGADFAAGPGLANLGEEPRVANRAASDHEAARAGDPDDAAGGGDVADVAVGEDGAGHEPRGAGDGVVMDDRLVHFAHGAAVDGEGVDGVAPKEIEQAREFIGRVEADAGLDREGEVHGGAEAAEDGVDLGGIAEKAAAGFLAADDGRGAAEIEVDAGDVPLLQRLGGALEGGDLLADHLGDDRLAVGILVDGAEDVLLGPGIVVDAKIFGVIEIGSAPEAAKHAPEIKIGDVLHGREDQQRAVGGEGEHWRRLA